MERRPPSGSSPAAALSLKLSEIMQPTKNDKIKGRPHQLLILMSLMITVHGAAQSFSDVSDVLRDHILAEAEWAMTASPRTITSSGCSRSAGGKHDFYSEGDYWWPDPQHPGGPYIQRDGITNPDNFVDHRKALIRLSRIVGALASAYRLTGDDQYAARAFAHLNAWFVDTTTRMNPSLLYAQAISGRVTGRGIGIIDTIHLMEVAQGTRVIEASPLADQRIVGEVKHWFDQYLQWLLTHPYSRDEMNATNNHGTCWVMQVASFARLTASDSILRICRDRYKEIILPNQMATDGSFPRELGRTKPYGYSLFNLDAMAMVCQILSDDKNDLWNVQTADGKNIRKGIDFMYPFVRDKQAWPYAHDVMYWDNWPVAHPFLIMGAAHFGKREWFETWKSLDHDPKVDEVLRNLPIRNPLIWLYN
ncbi:MAG TPA: alginate lyase family protein [Cyclobacteriaceae bacterium]|nr:alginate lyase family protein [Cyclobacteriaceae bacterium]